MMKCVAIDDEPIALSIIEQYCKRLEDVEIVTFTDPIEGLKCVCNSSPDVVFIDIEMGDINGIELARKLPQGVCLIFSTAYAQFAIDGFELNAVDFLHKPFAFSRFERAIQKVANLKSLSQKTIATNSDITVKVEYHSVKINTSTINYIEAMDNYVRIHTSTSRPIISQMSMKSIEEILTQEDFMRLHKSYIVSRRSIESYTRTQVTLHDNSTLPIGRTYQNEFAEWISKVS